MYKINNYNGYVHQLELNAVLKKIHEDIQAIDPSTGNGIESFLELEDTPESFEGEGDKYLAVKTDESGLSFVEAPTVPQTFTDLDDTESYSGQAGNVVVVNETEDGLTYEVFAPVSGFVDLDDTPDSYEADKFVAVNSAGDGLVFVDAPSGNGDGASSFTDLEDTPGNYSGESGKVVAVNSAEDGLEFIDPPSGNGGGDGAELDADMDIFTGPGPKQLQAGDWRTIGYFGEVPPSAFVDDDHQDNQSVSIEIGMGEGSHINANAPWLKFIYFGRIIFIPKRAIKRNVDPDYLFNNDWADGTKTVTFDDCEFDGLRIPLQFAVYLPSGAIGKHDEEAPFDIPGDTGDPNKNIGLGSMWNQLIYRLSSPSFSGSTDDAGGPEVVTDKWESFSASDLGISWEDDPIMPDASGPSEGSFTICTPKYTTRGGATDDGQSDEETIARVGYEFEADDKLGWRPVLELRTTSPVYLPRGLRKGLEE